MNPEDVCNHISRLVSQIQEMHGQISCVWRDYASDNGLHMFNQRKVRISEVFKNPQYQNTIYRYTDFLNERTDIRRIFFSIEPDVQITSRVKSSNSIQEKLSEYHYVRRVEKGDVNCNKCFNDLFGIRVIYDIEELPDLSFLEDGSSGAVTANERNVPPNASGHPYVATHIYFKKDNSTFKWELQVWCRKDEKSNQLAHRYHRHEYTDWETEVTGNA